MVKIGKLFGGLPENADGEAFSQLVAGEKFRLARIVSTGQVTPESEWYDQDEDEWVVLLSGSAGLLFEGEETARQLKSGDYLNIPAHCRHRVEWTAANEPTVWLALHYVPDAD